MSIVKEKTAFGNSQLESNEIRRRISIGIMLYTAKQTNKKQYEEFRESQGLNTVMADRYITVARFVAMENEGMFNIEHVYRTHWSTLVVLAAKPEDAEIHRMLLHLTHYAMLRQDRGLPVSEYSIKPDSTTCAYVLANKSSNYIKAMFARALQESGVQLNDAQQKWLQLGWEPLVIDKKKNLKTIASEMTQDIQDELDIQFERDGAEYDINPDMSYIEPEREAAVLKVFAQQNGTRHINDSIEDIIQRELEKHFGNITAPDAEELRKLQAENEMLRNKLHDILMAIRSIEQITEDAKVAAQLLIDTASTALIVTMRDEISDLLNK